MLLVEIKLFQLRNSNCQARNVEQQIASNAHWWTRKHKLKWIIWSSSLHKHLIVNHEMWSTCGSAKYVKMRTVTSAEQYRGHTRGPTLTVRGCFFETKWENSALSMHAKTKHEEVFDLRNFEITLVKKCCPQVIRREEFKYIDKYRTKTTGINRYKNW